MAWFFRAIEQADGRWACSHGRAVFDRHNELSDALDHLRDIAATMSPAELFVHRLDGNVESVRVGVVTESPPSPAGEGGLGARLQPPDAGGRDTEAAQVREAA